MKRNRRIGEIAVVLMVSLSYGGGARANVQLLHLGGLG